MLVANAHVGHRDDPDVEARLADEDGGETPARVVLSDVERRRSRVRTETEDGRDLGIVVSRELGDGDVLETESGTLVVVELAAVDALVLGFEDADVSATAALEIGHALGNRHLDLAVRGEEALFPVPDTRERMRETVDGLLPERVTVRFETVPPTTFGEVGGHDGSDHEYGHRHDHGGDADGHHHDHEHGGDGHDHGEDHHEHDHGGHDHGHDHGYEHTHRNGHDDRPRAPEASDGGDR
jgi:urease accessory protein